jgi:apolipoprotein D and lipocalin family protein
MLISISYFQCLTSPEKSTQKIPLVENLDLDKFTSNQWYEIARIPIPIGSDWVQTISSYKKISDKEIQSSYKGINPDGKVKELNGKAKIVTNSLWEISYIPLLYSDYRIIKLTSDYKNTMVTSGTKDYLWIMCSEPFMKDSVYQEFLNFAKEQGFDISKLEMVKQ